ncbi:MAG TPA: DUF2071 domain-containing protein [Gemmatimonadales bacterium]|nr:DUF2071 domain-containing protein [Gemmatimonadales bacterium]
MTTERPFLTAAWRHLAMLNYEVPRSLLEPLVPAGTELDTFDGAVLASVVGFRFLDTRVLGIAVPGHRDFDEVNLRFYVRRRGEDERWRRAVVFVRELVPRRAVAVVARWCYNEPYTVVPMRHELALEGKGDGAPGRAAYFWQLGGRWHSLEVRTVGGAALPQQSSEAEFVTDHYWGYTAQRDGGCKEYQVVHPPWRVWQAVSAEFDCDVHLVYGAGFAECLTGPPRSAFLAEGSEVSVYRGRRLDEQEKLSRRRTAHTDR